MVLTSIHLDMNWDGAMLWYEVNTELLQDEFKVNFTRERVTKVLERIDLLQPKLEKVYGEIRRAEEEKFKREEEARKAAEEKEREIQEMERLRIEASKPRVDAFAIFASGQTPLIPDGRTPKGITLVNKPINSNW